MKQFIFLILILFSVNPFFSDEIDVSIVEKTGVVDIKNKDEEWKSANIGDKLFIRTEIFTGLHSQLSIKIDNTSFVTVNQLSSVIISSIERTKDSNMILLEVKNGFFVILSKRNNKIKNNIVLTFSTGKVSFENSGGELYLGTDRGMLLKVSNGKVKVEPKIKTFYTLGKNEMCGITKDGYLVENDVFIRRNINTISNHIKDKEKISLFLEQLSQPGTLEFYTNDFFDNQNP